MSLRLFPALKSLTSLGLLAGCALSYGLFAAPAQAEMHEDGHSNISHSKSDTAMFSVPLFNGQGEQTGMVEIQNADTGSLLTVEVMNVSAGWHGFHIHETGDCSDTDTFKSAGGHAAFTNQGHGLLDEEEIHAGDMPNVWVHEDGTGKAQIYIRDDIFDSLNDEDGSAFVMHAGADDYKTDPAGAAGNRIACGVIFAPVAMPDSEE